MISKNRMGISRRALMRGIALSGAIAVFVGGKAYAINDLLAQWTFETTLPSTAGPFAPETGSGSATGLHAGSSTYSSPAGNGSAHSFSSNVWAVGDYYQLQTSTSGASTIGIQFDQVSSTTGPRDWKVQYSTDGTSFTDFGTYKVDPNSVPAWSSAGPTTPIGIDTYSFDFSSVTALNNQANIYVRLTDTSTSAANNTGTVATAGTDRIDNFSIFKNFDKTQSPIIQPPAAPVAPAGNDVIVGYDGNRGNDTLDLVRGSAVTNGGVKPAAYGPWQNVPFVGSSLAFDNTGGTAHNAHGNLLGTDTGSFNTSNGAVTGGKIYNLATTGALPICLKPTSGDGDWKPTRPNCS